MLCSAQNTDGHAKRQSMSSSCFADLVFMSARFLHSAVLRKLLCIVFLSPDTTRLPTASPSLIAVRAFAIPGRHCTNGRTFRRPEPIINDMKTSYESCARYLSRCCESSREAKRHAATEINIKKIGTGEGVQRVSADQTK